MYSEKTGKLIAIPVQEVLKFVTCSKLGVLKNLENHVVRRHDVFWH